MNKGYYLSILIGTFNPQPVPQAVIDALTEVQITASDGSQSGFQLRFTVGKQSLIERVLLPSGYFDPRTRVIIVVTVNGTPMVLMDGAITKQDLTPSNDPGKSELTITGLDISVLMDFIELTGIPYPAMPVDVVVALILAKYLVLGIVPVVVPTLLSLVELPNLKIRKQQGTDYQYINALGRQFGHVFYIEPGPTPGVSTAYWGPGGRSGTPQAALTVNMDAATNVESLSFSYNALAKSTLLVSIIEPNTKLPIPIPVPDIAALKPILAQDTTPSLKTRTLETAHLSPIEAALTAVGELFSAPDVIGASGSLDVLRYGHILEARKLVTVRGAGVMYDGLYYVKSVTHSIKPGEYKQNFSLARGGVKSSVSTVGV